jgi:NAD dependent epimerase/dehydratase family enzyme
VLDRNTPALDRLTSVARWGLGGRIGSGKQWISWLHIKDFLAIVDRVVADPTLTGVVHATSPNPVPNAELMRELRRAVHRPPALPTPGWLVKVGAVALRTDPALALTGRRAVPATLAQAGFEFEHPQLAEALAELTA